MSTERASHLDATDWHCETCGKSGRIEYVVGAGVYEVLHILEDAHGEASGGTCTRLDKVRVTPVNGALSSQRSRASDCTPNSDVAP